MSAIRESRTEISVPFKNDDAQKRSFQDVVTEQYNDLQRLKGEEEHPLHRPGLRTWQTMAILAANTGINFDVDDHSVVLSE